MAQAVLLLGGNLGNVAENLTHTRSLLRKRAGAEILHSTIMASKAWGFEGPDFLNQAVVIETPLTPEQLLETTQEIEREMGRTAHDKTQGYASRTMDIDILFYDNRILHSDRLTIPHPLLAERDFVLNPLVEILPDWIHPESGKTIRELHKQLLEK